MNYKSLLPVILLFLFINCKKGHTDPGTMANTTKLDCTNLKIRKVIFNAALLNKPQTIHVSLENTCKSCTDNWVYLGLCMVNKTTGDTVARTCLSCLSGVSNKTTGVYELTTDLASLPDLKTIRFDYSYLCQDVPYDPK